VWDNLGMTRAICFSKWALAAVVTIALGGCETRQATASGGPDQTKADQTAVLQTLAGIEQRINQGDLGFVDVFAKDAVIIAPSSPDIVGFDAIRTTYSDLMKKVSMTVHFSTEEVAVAGDLAYERGTYTLKLVDKASGKTLEDVKNNHLHIFRRQPDGTWKTWRMMVNSAELTASPKVGEAR
jgi:ketosteroid isomerase-like protein